MNGVELRIFIQRRAKGITIKNGKVRPLEQNESFIAMFNREMRQWKQRR